MIFGLNPEKTPNCIHCGKDRKECGWTLWYDIIY
jgi:hypothetical protein